MDKAKDMAGKHDDKVDQGLEKVDDQIDQRTGNKYDAQTDRGIDELQKRTGQGDTVQ